MQSREGLNHRAGGDGAVPARSEQALERAGALPQPADKQLVPPVVASAWRELAPSYTVREIFSNKREEVRAAAAAIDHAKLAADGIVVEEVMLADIQLPEQYAKGLEGLLLKEQEDDQMAVMTEIQQKQVKIAELQAEAEAEAEREAGRGRRAFEGDRGQGRSGCDAIHASAEAEAD